MSMYSSSLLLFDDQLNIILIFTFQLAFLDFQEQFQLIEESISQLKYTNM